MSDDMLSQDDIDALMSGLDTDDGAEEDSSGASALDPENLRPFIKLFCEQSSSVVTTVLSKDVDMRVESLQEPTDESIAGDFAEGCLQVRIVLESDLDGSLYFVISKKNTAILADLMMMGDGSAEFEEDHTDALSELLNQIMGSMVIAANEKFSMTLGTGQAETAEWDPANLPCGLEGSVQALVGLKVEGIVESTILLLMDPTLSASIDKHFATPTAEESAVADDAIDAGSALPETGAAEILEPGIAEGDSVFDSTGNKAMDMLLDIDLDLTIEMGRTRISLKRILEMGPGSIVEMNRFAGEPVDLLIGDKVVARGEVVVVDENFGVRIVSLVTPEERLKLLR